MWTYVVDFTILIRKIFCEKSLCQLGEQLLNRFREVVLRRTIRARGRTAVGWRPLRLTRVPRRLQAACLSVKRSYHTRGAARGGM